MNLFFMKRRNPKRVNSIWSNVISFSKHSALINSLLILLLLTGISLSLNLFLIKPIDALTEGPSVASTIPEADSVEVDLNRPIYITFDREIDPKTINENMIILTDSKNPTSPVALRSVHYDSLNKTAVLIPLTSLKQDETYQVKVTTGVQDINQFPMLQDFLWSFKTTVSGTTPVPQVLSTIPGIEEREVGTKRVISVRFNHDMKPETITNMTFLVKNATTQQPVVAKTVTYDTASRIAAFVPENTLSSNMTYTATITQFVMDSEGIPLSKDYIWSFTTGEDSYNNPHGNYTDNTMACSYCHQTHTAQGTALLKQTTQTALCFTCHDGTGSNYNVKGNLDSTDPSVKTFHPVMDTGNLEIPQLLQCSDCHNPHGDKDALGNDYKKLLRVTDGTTTAYQGNDVCLKCHGENDRKFTATYYSDTAGNHTNVNAAHFDTAKSSLLPLSGTLITCSKCHSPHSGKYNQLTVEQEENLCITCHTNPANSHSGTGNINEQFFGSPTVTIVSKHDLTSVDNGKVECSSCHGPHTAGAASLSEGKAYSDLADPQNTKNVFTTVTGTPNATVGNMTDFCLKCHGSSPPVAERSSTKLVPFSIIFPQVAFSNGSGWNKSVFTTSKHSQSGYSCEKCHEPHGSQYPSLQSRGEDTTSSSGECLTCHASVGNALKQTSHHPTLEISGKHKNTETAADKLDSSKRHAECVDCHDPHSVTETMKTVKLGNSLCLDCHIIGGTSGFSKADGTNLHISSSHSQQTCNACHVTVPHGSNYPKLLSTTIEDPNSKLLSFTRTTNDWTEPSCATVIGCHSNQLTGTAPLAPNSLESAPVGTPTDSTLTPPPPDTTPSVPSKDSNLTSTTIVGTGPATSTEPTVSPEPAVSTESLPSSAPPSTEPSNSPLP